MILCVMANWTMEKRWIASAEDFDAVIPTPRFHFPPDDDWELLNWRIPLREQWDFTRDSPIHCAPLIGLLCTERIKLDTWRLGRSWIGIEYICDILGHTFISGEASEKRQLSLLLFVYIILFAIPENRFLGPMQYPEQQPHLHRGHRKGHNNLMLFVTPSRESLVIAVMEGCPAVLEWRPVTGDPQPQCQ